MTVLVQSRGMMIRLLLNHWLSLGQRSWVVPVVLYTSLAGLHLLSLDRTPPPAGDEAWFASHAWGLIQTGQPFGPLDAGVYEQFEGYWTYFSWLGAAVNAVPILAFGLSLYSVRLVALAFGFLLLAAVYVIGNHVGGRKIGLVAVLLVGLSNSFFFAAHQARPDIIVAAAGYGAVALYLTDRSSSWPIKSTLAGLAIGLAFEIHLNAVIYGPVIVGLCLLDYGRSTLVSRRFWGFVIGAAAGGALYLALHVLPYPSTYVALSQLTFGTAQRPPILDLTLLPISIVETIAFFLAFNVYRVPVAIGTLILLLRQRSPAETRLLALLVILLLDFITIIPNKQPYYPILLAPAVDLIIAVGLVKATQFSWRHSRPLALLPAASFILVTISILPVLDRVTNDPMNEYRVTVSRIRQVVPPGASILGEPTYWFGLADYSYNTWPQLTYYRTYAPGSSIEEAFRYLRPDYFVRGRLMDWHIRDDPNTFEPWAQRVYLPKTELEQFLQRRAELVAVIDTTLDGSVRVYRLRWD